MAGFVALSGSPLTRGIGYAVCAAYGSVMEVVTQTPLVRRNGAARIAPAVVNGRVRQVIDTENGANDYFDTGVRLPSRFGTGRNISIFTVARVAEASVDIKRVVQFSNTSGDTVVGVSFGETVNQYIQGIAGTTAGGFPSRSYNTVAYTAGEWYSVGYTRNISDTRTLYINGGANTGTNGSAAAGDLRGDVARIRIGGYDTLETASDVLVAAIWPRILTEAEFKSLHDDPMQLFRFGETSSRVYLSLVADAAGSPNITSLGTKLESGQALVINGGSFGASETGSAAVTISPAAVDDGGAVIQTGLTWSDNQITVASASLTGMADSDTVNVYVTDSAGAVSSAQSVQIADMVLRVGPPVATDDILDTDTGLAIASESLVKVAVMTTDLETVVAAYTDATITAGKFEYDDSSVANITTEDDEFVVVMNGGTSRLGALRATVVDRNED